MSTCLNEWTSRVPLIADITSSVGINLLKRKKNLNNLCLVECVSISIFVVHLEKISKLKMKQKLEEGKSLLKKLKEQLGSNCCIDLVDCLHSSIDYLLSLRKLSGPL